MSKLDNTYYTYTTPQTGLVMSHPEFVAGQPVLYRIERWDHPNDAAISVYQTGDVTAFEDP